MTSVWWLLQHVSDVPAGDDWLSPGEQDALARFWVPKRIRDWRLGRWTGKRALARAGIGELREQDIPSLARASIAATESGSPVVSIDGREAGWVISLSHAGAYGACAIARHPASLGCDIEDIGRRGEEFVVDWFTERERQVVHALPAGEARSRVVTLVWSAKESALKALGVGLRLDTREVDVHLTDGGPGDDWSPLVAHVTGRALHGWWRTNTDRVFTIVADPAPESPRALGEGPAGPQP